MAYSKAQLDKIGNLLVYITSKLGAVSKTKLLKLTYIIEEEYVRQAGVSLTELTYMHWPNGPVSTFINTQIDKRRDALAPYITIQKGANATLVKPATTFDDSEFSEFDLDIIDTVLNRFGGCSAQQLIDYTHRDEGLWKKINDAHNGCPPAKTNLDLTLLLHEEPINPALREAAQEAKAFTDYLTTDS